MERSFQKYNNRLFELYVLGKSIYTIITWGWRVECENGCNASFNVSQYHCILSSDAIVDWILSIQKLQRTID